MAIALRVEYPNAFYHVINRGNAGDDMFKSCDREKFLDYSQTLVKRYGLKIHTYCLMTNNHLLVETPETNLSLAIKRHAMWRSILPGSRAKKAVLIYGKYFS